MKHIEKRPQPASLDAWKQGQIDAGIAPDWSDFQNPQKTDCQVTLIGEQGGICCYCNGRISALAMHIEHLTPRSADDSLALEWTNLLGCCLLQNKNGSHLKTQRHCGDFRGNRSLGVTPLDRDCELRFGYSLLGEIRSDHPNDVSALKTIKVLNLAAESLRVRRQRLIAQAYADLEILSESEWLAVYVERGPEGFHEFAAMFQWFLNSSWRAENFAP